MTKRSSLSKKSLLLVSSVEELTGRLYDAVIRVYDDAGNAIEAHEHVDKTFSEAQCPRDSIRELLCSSPSDK